MQNVYITIGIPGSGKTYWATKFINEAYVAGKTIIHVNNDNIRVELAGKDFLWSHKFEDEVRKVRFQRMKEALNNGYDLIVDNTHINPKTLGKLKTWIKQNFPEIEIIEKSFLDVPVELCLKRDAHRKSKGQYSVGPECIMKMARESGLLEIKPYPINPELPWTIICDLDGTLALFGNRRNAYDCSHCDETDEPNPLVLNLLRTYESCHISEELWEWECLDISKIHFFSGRKETYKEPTERFLLNKCEINVVDDPYFCLAMRGKDDDRSDEIVKKEMFDKVILNQYNVLCVIDDRPKVIRMWKSLGLSVLNVGEGIEF